MCLQDIQLSSTFFTGITKHMPDFFVLTCSVEQLAVATSLPQQLLQGQGSCAAFSVIQDDPSTKSHKPEAFHSAGKVRRYCKQKEPSLKKKLHSLRLSFSMQTKNNRGSSEPPYSCRNSKAVQNLNMCFLYPQNRIYLQE